MTMTKAVTLKGVSLRKLDISLEDGKEKLTGTYELMSSEGVVLAKQSFNDYSGIKVEWSSETKSALLKLMALAQSDIDLQLGFLKKGENDGE